MFTRSPIVGPDTFEFFVPAVMEKFVALLTLEQISAQVHAQGFVYGHGRFSLWAKRESICIVQSARLGIYPDNFGMFFCFNIRSMGGTTGADFFTF